MVFKDSGLYSNVVFNTCYILYISLRRSLLPFAILSMHQLIKFPHTNIEKYSRFYSRILCKFYVDKQQ